MRSHILLKLTPFLIGILIFFFLTLSGMVERLLAGTAIYGGEKNGGNISDEESSLPEVLKSSLEGSPILPMDGKNIPTGKQSLQSHLSNEAVSFSNSVSAKPSNPATPSSPTSNMAGEISPVFPLNLDKDWKISYLAREYGISPQSLISLNSFRKSTDLENRDSIMVPRVDGFRIRWNGKGGTTEIARYYGTISSMVWPLDSKGGYFVSGARQNIPFSQLKDVFLFPVTGDVIRKFGEGFDYITGIPYNSEGINITAESGTHVQASRSGKILRTGQHDSYGLYVMLEHDNEWMSFYSHLKRVDVAPGDKINQLDSLGLAGDSGIARSVQVHFALIHRNQVVNPLDYLR